MRPLAEPREITAASQTLAGTLSYRDLRCSLDLVRIIALARLLCTALPVTLGAPPADL